MTDPKKGPTWLHGRYNFDMETSAYAIVAVLAQALDTDDFDTVRPLLAADCVYETGRETLIGPEAIVQSYAANSAWARKTFDELRYESRVEPSVAATVAVVFIDLLRHKGLEHRHQCRQEFTVGSAGRIVRIVHHDLPGETEAISEFYRSCNIRRSS